MLNRILAVVVALIVASPVAFAQDKSEPKAKAGKSAQDAAEKPKKDKKGKKEKKEKKDKKAKKPKSDVPAPDEKVDATAAAQAESGGKGPHVTWKQHPSFRAGSLFRIDFTAKFQEDGRNSYTDRNLDPWELHRNRIGVSGHFFKHFEYEAEYELTEKELTEKDIARGETPSSHWKDLFIDFKYFDNAQIQVGKFKIPFGLDTLTGVSNNDFIYRSLGANYLTPSRDIGAQVHGRFFKRGLGYWVGVFEHDGDNARSKKIQGGDETIAFRLTGMPLRRVGKAFEQLELGFATTSSNLTDDSFRPNGLRGRTLVTQDDFYEPVYVKGRRNRYEADADWMMGPFGARAEYTHVLDDRLSQGILDNDLVDARGRAWYAQGSWVVTGEPKKRPVKPANDFITGGGFGAIEVAARIERLWFDSVGGGEPYRSPRAEAILPASERVLTIGLNWTLNRFIKLQFNGLREEINGIRERTEIVDREPVPSIFWSRVFRLQLVL